MNEELKLLMVEDSTLDAGLVERALRHGGLKFLLRRTDNEDDFRQALHEFAPDAVLSDLSLPLFSGLEALSILREEAPEVPLIFVSGTVGEEKAVDLLKLGATDYVVKQHLSRLTPAVRRALREVQLKREQSHAEKRYQSIFENASIGIYQVNADGRYLAINPTLATLCGYASAAEMMGFIGSGHPLFVEEERRSELIALMEVGGKITNFQAELYRHDRSRFSVVLHASLVRDAKGNTLLYECFVVDISRQKELEEQMLRAQRMESIGTLASGVAHDLNNIISPIMMATAVLHYDPSKAEREKLLSIIEASAKRGAQIVRQVLTFGRGLEGERHPLQVGSLIKEVLRILDETFPKDIRVENSLGADLRLIVGDATQIHQVLLNLCVNARDVLPDGGTLRITAENLTVDESYASMLPEASPGEYVVVEVSDTGTGIPPEIMHRIFDPFFTTKGVGQGTGLGLSTVLGIVKTHGGFVKVRSEPNLGTTFAIYFPAAPSDAVEPVPLLADQVPAGKGELVLVVDDEEMICLAASKVLEVHGYRVLVARDGTEALAVFAQNQGAIAAVLTDVMMPFMDGVALTRALRRMAPGLFIIASTGQGEKTRMAELRSMNVDAILAKPYAAELLLRTLHDGLHPVSGGSRANEPI